MGIDMGDFRMMAMSKHDHCEAIIVNEDLMKYSRYSSSYTSRSANPAMNSIRVGRASRRRSSSGHPGTQNTRSLEAPRHLPSQGQIHRRRHARARLSLRVIFRECLDGVHDSITWWQERCRCNGNRQHPEVRMEARQHTCPLPDRCPMGWHALCTRYACQERLWPHLFVDGLRQLDRTHGNGSAQDVRICRKRWIRRCRGDKLGVHDKGCAGPWD